MRSLIVALLLVCAGAAQAAYFRLAIRPADKGYLYESFGAFVDPVEPGQSSVAKQVALVSHSPKDGCMFPTIVCEDWSPLALGFGVNSGRFLFGLGPSINMAPVMRGVALALLRSSTAEDTLPGLKATLQPVPDSKLTLAISPSLVLSPTEAWKGRFKIFVGPAWRF